MDYRRMVVGSHKERATTLGCNMHSSGPAGCGDACLSVTEEGGSRSRDSIVYRRSHILSMLELSSYRRIFWTGLVEEGGGFGEKGGI